MEVFHLRHLSTYSIQVASPLKRTIPTTRRTATAQLTQATSSLMLMSVPLPLLPMTKLSSRTLSTTSDQLQSALRSSTASDYKSGVYTSTTCGNTQQDVNHAVLAVGYGNEDGMD